MSRSSAPPPVITMPFSTMSAASSGGACSSAIFTPSTICRTGSEMASATWASVMVISFGTPFTRSRPRTSILMPVLFSGLRATPMFFLIRSALASPMSRLCVRRI